MHEGHSRGKHQTAALEQMAFAVGVVEMACPRPIQRLAVKLTQAVQTPLKRPNHWTRRINSFHIDSTSTRLVIDDFQLETLTVSLWNERPRVKGGPSLLFA